MEDYLPYCHADKFFYEHPSAAGGPNFAMADRSLPETWNKASDGYWTYFGRKGKDIPEQGWKIHVSVRPEDAEDTMEIVAAYCLAQDVDFKFLTKPTTHRSLNDKGANRGSSGKLITMYPDDETALTNALDVLAGKLSGRSGPYILSDLRWGDGPLYVRYGGFRKMYCTDENGHEQLAVRRPDGTLVPDRREPRFHVPDWVSVPDSVARMMETHATAAVDGMPYAVESALHFSNAGGIYLARDPSTGRRVVLREARPHAGLDGSGRDAVSRLYAEAETLQALSDLEFVPSLLRTFTVWEHHFLAEEYIEGDTLWSYLAAHNPLTSGTQEPERATAYAAEALGLCDQLERALQELHDTGYVFADLHPRNILVRPDGRIALVDFEIAYRPDRGPAPRLGCPGFIHPEVLDGPARDWYALDCIRLAMFLPLTTLLDLDKSKIDDYAEIIGEHFPSAAPAMTATQVSMRRALGLQYIPARPGSGFTAAAGDPSGPAMDALLDKIREAVAESATPERTDRLFPGDPRALTDGGYDLAHGAAGVLFALHDAGHPVDPGHVDWLARTALRVPARAGLHDGLHGAALVLHGLGREDEALRVLERADAAASSVAAPHLRGGLAGIGFTTRYFASVTGDSVWRARTDEVIDRLASQLSVPGTSRAAGLMDGWTGAASLLLRTYEDTQDTGCLDLAKKALDRDLDFCEANGDGEVSVRDGRRLLPYLGTGSAGLAEPMAAYLRFREDERLRETYRGILLAAQARFTVEPGLLAGRAGLMAMLAAQPEFPGRREALTRHVRGLALHAVSLKSGIAFPGRWLLRLSMDLATGGAGILLALCAARRCIGAEDRPAVDTSPSIWSQSTGLPLSRSPLRSKTPGHSRSALTLEEA
ncbi:class III lanthionine synthetase LanKC [Streptomyces maremycinicus]|uniref:class III lanthionine synthetase LanKC n=1 Tax=Streptomyces maremycinicus TaxID=1679753 RepID=UPI000788E947|nr:class III lanthionine synthetase LanKC [Streptomyces sp. NBRC 110468]